MGILGTTRPALILCAMPSTFYVSIGATNIPTPMRGSIALIQNTSRAGGLGFGSGTAIQWPTSNSQDGHTATSSKYLI